MKEVIIASIALGITGFCFALLLSFLNRKLKVEEDPRVSQIVSLLPGANCGACGFAGCRGFAQAIIKEGKIFSGCIPGGKEINDKIIQILGVETTLTSHKRVTICQCGASFNEKKVSSLYNGPKSCRAAQITGGAIDCIYGCLGFGDCIKACPTKAITLNNGRIIIDIKKCTGCGYCLKICPRNLFKTIPWKNDINIYWVACNNKEKALGVKLVCQRGCIGCGICTKVPNSPYYLQDNLSAVDYKKKYDNTALEEGKNKCPTKCIFAENV
ncbi:MAG: RnfABCDGE type electron transport complex subunit B [Candidatus Omnitrophica bacterium]|jgi:RnfABCDGE-type electron transport complex B subunit|nr:RnfABCDGE type electron transport complex subunit B [Candidatus Omnitrophota bacterium]